MRQGVIFCAVLVAAILFHESSAITSGSLTRERTVIIAADNDGDRVSLFETLLANAGRDRAEQEEKADHVEVIYDDDPRFAELREIIYKDTPHTSFAGKTARAGAGADSFNERWAPLVKFEDRWFVPPKKKWWQY